MVRRAKNQAFLILCLGLVAVPQTASGQSPANGQDESERDLSGTWSVTVHLTITHVGAPTETHDYKGKITFVPSTTDHYTASGQVNLAPKTDEERIYNIYFQSCARGGHDIAKASSRTYDEYECSYEYGESLRLSEQVTITTIYKGDLTFELNSGTLRGKTSFSVRPESKHEIVAHSEEAEWTGERPANRQDGATTQRLSRPYVGRTPPFCATL